MGRSFGERVNQILVRDQQLAAAVRREVEKGLAQMWSLFERVCNADKIHPAFAEHEESPDEYGEDAMGGWRLFRWRAEANVWFFLEIAISGSKFHIALLWNTTDQPPAGANRYAHMFDAEPWQHMPNSSSPQKEWKVGTNAAFAPEVVVRAAIAELKAFAEPIILKVLERHGTRSSPNVPPTV